MVAMTTTTTMMIIIKQNINDVVSPWPVKGVGRGYIMMPSYLRIQLTAFFPPLLYIFFCFHFLGPFRGFFGVIYTFFHYWHVIDDCDGMG